MLPPWNAVRFDPARPPRGGHVESYFLKLNDPDERRALWLKATILARAAGPAVAEAWAIGFDRDRGHRAAKEVFPLGSAWSSDASFSADGLDVRVGSLRLREGATSGDLTSQGVRVRWDLTYEPLDVALVPFPSPRFYTGSFPRSKLVSPCPHALFSGWYEVDGARTEVAGWRGMQGHNWGAGHAFRYAWAHCNQFEQDPDFLLEGLTGRVRVGPALTPPITLLCVRHRGVRYEWTRLVDWPRSRGSMTTRRWEFSAHSDLGRIEGHLEATTEDLVGLLYENPSGPPAHCLNSKLSRAEVLFQPAGRPPLRLTSRSAALEIGTTDTSHGVKMHV